LVYCLVLAYASGNSKISPKLAANFYSLPVSTDVSFIAMLPQANLDSSKIEPNDRPTYVYETLSKWAEDSQAPLQTFLKEKGISFKSYWVSNSVVIKANSSVMFELAAREDVTFLEQNDEFRVPLEVPELIESDPMADTIEWNVEWVKAPAVWARNNRGKGFVVANADTGVAWNHPALIRQYRGSGVGTTDHNYNWWDAIHDGGSNRCGLNVKVPCDDNGHGTHTTGTAVGNDNNGYYIGVAPDAQWIACRNMNAGFGTPQRYIECLQFFIAPTDLNGQNPDTSRAPHSVGNSYGCPTGEGCNAQSLLQAVKNVQAAGIFMAVSAGNAGPGCSSVNDPPAIHAEVCSIGATGLRTNNIASYSSRGPVTYDGSNRLKPNIVAPGSSVRSAYPPTGYATLSGTSMASPAVAGAIPLLWAAKPELLRNTVKTTEHLQATATPLSSPTTQCGIPPNTVPNQIYGYGAVDVDKACS